MPPRQPQPARKKTDTLIGIDESELWSMADALGGSMDAAEHKNVVVLGLIFLKYISDAFEERHAAVLAEYFLGQFAGAEGRKGGERPTDDKRWQYGVPPKVNANYGWVQHIVHHLAPRGAAGFVLANGSMSSNQSSEGDIRRNLIEADLVDCMVALPGQLFYSTQIPACLWFLSRDRSGGTLHARRGETLFIDARELGSMVDRTHRELTAEDIDRIADTYHRWRCVERDYEDEPGFCRSVPLEELRRHDHALTPGCHVGAPPAEDNGEPFADKMQRLVAELRDQQAEGARLDAAIRANPDSLGFGAPRE